MEVPSARTHGAMLPDPGQVPVEDGATAGLARAWSRALVSEVMSRPVLAIDATETLWDAWQLLSVSGLRHLAVVEDDACIGVISDRNILSDVPVSQDAMRARPVGDLVSRGSHRWVADDQRLSVVAWTMAHYSIEAVPVLDHTGRLVGIVTGSDLVRWWAHEGP